MKNGRRTVVYDRDLRLEAYQFEGILQPFPNHFHEHYVIGFVAQGERILFCRNCEYDISKGNIVLFHPGESHGCISKEGKFFDYRGLHIGKEVMLDWIEEITGERKLPEFRTNVICDDKDILCYLRRIHELIVNKGGRFEKEEMILLLIAMLTERYGEIFQNRMPKCRKEIDTACTFLKEHYAEQICLEQVCQEVGLSKSTLLRAFVKEKGMTPYRYLENIRVGEARKLLEQGETPIRTAMQTGFSDQSHFTNYFSRFIGLPPGLYRDILYKKEECQL